MKLLILLKQYSGTDVIAPIALGAARHYSYQCGGGGACSEDCQGYPVDADCGE